MNHNPANQFQKGHKINLGKKNALGHKSTLGKHWKLSEETKRKMSKSKKKKSFFTEEWRQKLRQAKIGKTGILANGWKGNNDKKSENQRIRSSIEMKLWIQSIFVRDGYICQKTGQIGGKLVAHHILNFSLYPELRTAIDNGITFSEETHRKFHKKYGRKNNTCEQLEEFLLEIN